MESSNLEANDEKVKKNKRKEYMKQYNKQYKEQHRNEIRQYMKQYYNENRNKINKYQKQYYDEHRNEIKEYKKQYMKQYYNENKNEIKEYKKQYNKQHRNKMKEYKKQYMKQYRDKIKEYNEQYSSNLRHQALMLLASDAGTSIPQCRFCHATKNLEIDHTIIDGVFGEDRDELGKKYSTNLVREVLNAPENIRKQNFEILCKDCNNYKRSANISLFTEITNLNFERFNTLLQFYSQKVPIDILKTMITNTANRQGYSINWVNHKIYKVD
ncbi:MAG: hypothetical protein QW478_13655 [Candidatus Micrarchaeaceae archaeon]